MCRLRTVTDVDACQELWQRHMPREGLTDLWEVRACFHRHYQRPLRFLVAEEGNETVGFLPLSWMAEVSRYGYFPGEAWHGRTWLEQNRIPGADDRVLSALLGQSNPGWHIRYLLPLASCSREGYAVDEVGYLFLPPQYDYDITNYFEAFSHRSAKRLRRELDGFERGNLAVRYDCLDDFGLLVALNLDRFGADSYFHDSRFLRSFRSLMHLLNDRGWLRLTTVIVGGEVAAVDMGCVYGGTYTLLAGGTNGRHPGVAKFINVLHMRRSCEDRFDCVDFLCGDFSWKTRFHLTPRPLYLLTSEHAHAHDSAQAELRSLACGM